MKYLVKIIEKYDIKFALYADDAVNPLVTEANKYLEDNPAPTGTVKLKYFSLFHSFILKNSILEDKAAEEIVLNYDKELAKLVDKLILYLRLVHSVDYYNNAEYRNEDEMPNRCGIIHVRYVSH